jgi:hypothetical protein
MTWFGGMDVHSKTVAMSPGIHRRIYLNTLGALPRGLVFFFSFFRFEHGWLG